MFLIHLSMLVHLITFSNSELMFNIQPSFIRSESNETIVVVNCSIAADWVPGNNSDASLFLGRLNATTNETQDILSLNFDILNQVEFTQIENIQNAEPKFGAHYLSLILTRPSRGDAGVYYCEGYGISKRGRIRERQTLEFKEPVSDSDEQIQIATEGNLEHEDVTVSSLIDSTVKERLNATLPANPEKALLISVLPNNLSDVEFLRDFQVTCNFSRINSPDMIRVFSMIVSHSTKHGLPEYKDLLVITLLDGQTTKVAEGTFNYTFDRRDDGEWSITIVLDPSKYERTGLYKCDVNGIDVLGKPLKFSRVASEDYIDIILDMLKVKSSQNKGSIHSEGAEIVFLKNELNKTKQSFKRLTDNYKELVKQLGDLLGRVEEIQNELYIQRSESFTIISEVSNLTALQSSVNTKVDKLESAQSTMQKSLANLNKHVSRLDTSINSVDNKLQDTVNICTSNISEISDKVDALRKITEDPKSIFKVSLNSLFLPSAPYKGRKYWLTRRDYDFFFVTDAEVICRSYGGYLAEIDSDEEFHFIRNFVKSHNLFEFVVTGGTDAVVEGQWVNRFTYNSFTAFNWGKGEPNDSANEDCQCFYRSKDWMMNDCKCNFAAHGNVGFLCEILE